MKKLTNPVKVLSVKDNIIQVENENGSFCNTCSLCIYEEFDIMTNATCNNCAILESSGNFYITEEQYNQALKDGLVLNPIK